MVVICDVPTLSTGVMQDRAATPSTCTVQAPQSATPQPNLVPVMPRTSRNTQSSGVSPSTSTLCVLPLTLMSKAMAYSPFNNQFGIPPREGGRSRPRLGRHKRVYTHFDALWQHE